MSNGYIECNCGNCHSWMEIIDAQEHSPDNMVYIGINKGTSMLVDLSAIDKLIARLQVAKQSIIALEETNEQ